METLMYEGVMTALSSISHNGGQSFGINSKLRREKFVQPDDDSVAEIPVLSGNGLRGMLRDRGMLHMCRQLGFGTNEETGEISGLTLPAFYFLFSGGTLTSQGGRGLDIDLARRLRELIPLVSLFGGAVGNQIMPGKVKVGKAIPICIETRHVLPKRFLSEKGKLHSIWDLLQEEMYTRKDDEKNEHLRLMMAPQVLLLMDAKRQGQRAARENDQPQEDVGEHQQMRYYVETFAAGTRFYWYISLDDANKVEYEALMTTLAEFAKSPYVGGKSGTGLGKVKLEFDKWYTMNPLLEPAPGTALDVPLGALYSNHLATRGGEIRAELDRMQ